LLLLANSDKAFAGKLGEGWIYGAEARINEVAEKAVFDTFLDLVTRGLL
jgi:hypothetical protein